MRRVLPSLLALALACRDDPPASREAAPASSASKPSIAATAVACSPDHAALHRERYAGFCVDPQLVGEHELATIGGPATRGKPDAAVQFTIDGMGLQVFPERFATDPETIRSEVQDEIDKQRAIAEANGERAPDRFVLAIDRRVAMRVVHATGVALVEAGLPTGTIALASKERTPPAVHPEIYAKLAPRYFGEELDMRVLEVSRALDPLVAGCPALDEAFSAAKLVANDQQCTALTNALPDAFVACGCPETEPEIMTWVQLAANGEADKPLVQLLPIELAIATSAGEITATTWGEFVTAHANSLARIEVIRPLPSAPPPAG
jgi:hypothetical protein